MRQEKPIVSRKTAPIISVATKGRGLELQSGVNSATYMEENCEDRKRAIIRLFLEFGVPVARNPAFIFLVEIYSYLKLVNKRRLVG